MTRRWRAGDPLPRRLIRRMLGEAPVAIVPGPRAAWARAIRRARRAAQILSPGACDLARLDDFCRERAIRHLGLLCLPAGSALAVLEGAAGMLGHARIDAIAMRRGTLGREGEEQLRRHGYVLFPARPGFAATLRGWLGGRDDDIAVHERLVALMQDGGQGMLDLALLCRSHGIAPHGVVHVGAHEGQELADYRRMGLAAILFVEANPAVFARLAARCGAERGVVLANYAIAERAGPVRLHVTSADQGSSILPLARSRDYYPTIIEEDVREVPGRTLDGLLPELGLEPQGFNLLNIDIQGAELMALKGAEGLLRHIEAVNVEVNFKELYQGCAEIEDIDDHLAARGFRRVAMTCPFHHSWGDAFYVRDRARGGA